MEVYWLTFRLASNSTYSARYDALVEGVQAITKTWWVESSSFLLFQSTRSIDEIVAVVKAAIDESTDIALIGMPDYKTARVIGPIKDQDLFKLMPFTKKA